MRLVSVLVLGMFLLSCSPDKSSSAQERKIVDDSWQVDPPVIRGHDPGRPLQALSLYLKEPVPSPAQLEFPSLRDNDFAQNPVHIAVHSQCDNGQSQAAQDRSFEN